MDKYLTVTFFVNTNYSLAACNDRNLVINLKQSIPLVCPCNSVTCFSGVSSL